MANRTKSASLFLKFQNILIAIGVFGATAGFARLANGFARKGVRRRPVTIQQEASQQEARPGPQPNPIHELIY